MNAPYRKLANSQEAVHAIDLDMLFIYTEDHTLLYRLEKSVRQKSILIVILKLTQKKV